MTASLQPPAGTLNDSRVLLDAHRGDSAHYPENTLAAFRSALALDLDFIETDVHETRDGELVLIHDHTVDRTTDGRGLVREKTLAEIKRLDAGAWKGDAHRGERVPTLAEFLELVRAADAPRASHNRPRLRLIVELKDYPPDVGDEHAFAIADKTVAALERGGFAGRCFLNTWSGRLLEHLAAKHPEWPLEGYMPFSLMGDLARDPFEYIASACLFADARDTVADKTLFDDALAHGVEPWVYYKEERADLYALAAERGARALTANDPAKALRILRDLKLHA